MEKRKQILKQMFDVKPVNADGSLNSKKISDLKRVIKIVPKRKLRRPEYGHKIHEIKHKSGVSSLPAVKFSESQNAETPETKRQPNVFQMGKIVTPNRFFIARELISESPKKKEIFPESHSIPKKPIGGDQRVERSAPVIGENGIYGRKNAYFEFQEKPEPVFEQIISVKKSRAKKIRQKRKKIRIGFRVANLLPKFNFSRNIFAPSSTFLLTLLIFSLIIPSASFIQKGLSARFSILGSGEKALGQFASAKDNLVKGDFREASQNFENSHELLEIANQDILRIGGNFSEILRYIPGASKLATAEYIVGAGRDAALAGKSVADSLESLSRVGNPLKADGEISLTDLFLNLRSGVNEANTNLKSAQEKIKKANIDDLPPEVRPKFLELKMKLPLVIQNLQGFYDNSEIILDILGYNGPRKFLFLFQNNQEMRATGGFIGSYGILDIADGRIRKLFVDDIYNPDGQLRARVIPPEPIQKMSAVWTMHDANWFPNFPTSAEKVSWFYEKTGGPTVDGVVALTPNLIEKLLSITGPIEMPDYDAVIDSENFVSQTQTEVELDYDKEENRPKKFIADLMPKILDQVINTENASQMLEVLAIFDEALKEKQLLIYSKNYEVQKLISTQGWSGEVLEASKDYLSVINSNINGYKTDGVIDESIEHRATISDDGSIVDEVTITRKHNGGNEKYDWWNRVNGDYMRVYVPKNSMLLEATGQTREFFTPPLDYNMLGFKKDPQLEQQEAEMRVDEASGTRVYSENNKTVFANWVYASPGETVVLKYKYRLPFKLLFDGINHPADSFSVLFQKQSGSSGSRLLSEIYYPPSFKPIWSFPDSAKTQDGRLHTESDLVTDKFFGAAFQKDQ